MEELKLIWLTGDKHGQITPFSENSKYKKIKKNDTLIVCGDFGFLWNKSKQETKNLKWLTKRKYTIAFVDGSNDNYDIISEYPIEDWNGGKIRRISKNIVYLMRGELYDIENTKVLSFGGSFNDNNSNEETYCLENAYPTKQQIDNVINNIKKVNGEIDLIITHEAPNSIKSCLCNNKDEHNTFTNILEEIRVHSNFKKWFFGKYHIDKIIPPKYYAVFEDLIKLEK